MNYLKKQKFKYEFFAVATTVLILGVGIHYSIETIVLRKWTNSSIEVWAGVIIGLFIALLYSLFKKFVDKKFDGWIDQSINYKQGIAGELEVFEKLRELLPEDYAVIPSVVTGAYGDADIVAVGSKGVIVIEVKNWSDDVSVKNGKVWLKKYGGKQWNIIEKDPFAQVRGQSVDIDKILKENNLFIESSTPVVVFINNVQWEGKLKTLVGNVNSLDKILSYINNKHDKYNKDIIQKIAEKLREYSTA